MKYYAAINTRGFSNTWDVLVFTSKISRDRYISQMDGTISRRDNSVRCIAITKRQVSGYAGNYDMHSNRCTTPHPFTRECWIIEDNTDMLDKQITGYIGYVTIGHSDDNHVVRLFN